MKKYLIIVITSLITSSLIYSANLNVGKDKVVKINDTIITLQELETKYNEFSKVFAEGKAPSKKEILQKMINEKLILTEAKTAKNIILDENMVKQYMDYSKQLYREKMRSKDPNFTYSDEKFKQYLEKEEKITYEKFEAKLKETVLGEQYLMKRIEAQVNQLKDKKYTSPSDFPVKVYNTKGVLKSYNSIKEFYDDNLDQFLLKNPIFLKHIFKLTVVQSGSKLVSLPIEEKERVKKQIDDIYARLIKGESFDTLCELNSDDPQSREYINKKTGKYIRGYLGPIVNSQESVNVFGKELFDKILTLPVGKYSPVLEGKMGYHIFYVIEKKDHDILDFDDIKDELINVFKQSELELLRQADYDKLVKELRQKASITYYNEEYK